MPLLDSHLRRVALRAVDQLARDMAFVALVIVYTAIGHLLQLELPRCGHSGCIAGMAPPGGRARGRQSNRDCFVPLTGSSFTPTLSLLMRVSLPVSESSDLAAL